MFVCLTGYYYADDSQLLVSFEPIESIIHAERDIRKRCNDIKSWMINNILKTNEDKKGVHVFGTSSVLKQVGTPIINIVDTDIRPTSTVRNLGSAWRSTSTRSVKQAFTIFATSEKCAAISRKRSLSKWCMPLLRVALTNATRCYMASPTAL